MEFISAVFKLVQNINIIWINCDEIDKPYSQLIYLYFEKSAKQHVSMRKQNNRLEIEKKIEKEIVDLLQAPQVLIPIK